MLPLWIKQGKAVSIPLPYSKQINIPLIPLVLLLCGLAILFRDYILPSHTFAGYTKSSFRVDKSLFPPPPTEDRPEYLPLPLLPKRKGMVVPNSVHYVYGLKPMPVGGEREEFPYYAYLGIRSAMIHLAPEKIYFHYQHLPRGPWWDLLEPRLTLIETKAPDVYLGRNVTKYAHKADIVRLLLMKYSGGIYLDIDMFVIKPFDDLLYFPTTLGMESSTNMATSQYEPTGLCNALILSAPNSIFIDRWLASYETFDSDNWGYHSVAKPWEIARAHPTEIQVLNRYAFFWPMWSGDGVQRVHETSEHDFYASGQYAYHAWESLAWAFLGRLSPDWIRENDNSFNIMVRPFIGPDDDEVYRKWKQHSQN